MNASDKYFDALETRPTEQRLAQQLQQLPEHIRFARDNTRAYAELLKDVNPDEIDSLQKLASLPVTRKSELIEAQGKDKPFGGFTSAPAGRMRRVFSSPGPIYEPEGDTADYWRIARAMFAAGFRQGDLIHNSYSYHFTPAGSMMETAAKQIGAAVFPAGTGQSELQVNAINDLQSTAYTGTPSFLKILIDKAQELGLPLGRLDKALVSGEALPPSLRQAINEAGIFILQAYATADLGLIAYESEAMEGLIVDESVIVELVRPGTGDPVAEGEVGEVVVTTFNRHYPLLRFATGDLSAVLPGASPCGRTNTRIKGWMGRADQTTKIKGMFVHPQQVDKIVKRHPEILKARLVVSNPDNKDSLVLQCETSSPSDNLGEAVQASIREVIKLRSEVEIVAQGSLANDGKVIDDIRKYD
ncbi:MAG: AMP-binding protein [Gammaproteobacteria bacterium]|nr:AMP-binding protein [Gammaproteobacteria bacterium]